MTVMTSIRMWAAAAVIAIPVASAAQDWPRMDDGRVIVTVKGVRFALPTDPADLQEFRFASLPYDRRSVITLEKVLQDPDHARHLFDKWDDVSVEHLYDPTYGKNTAQGSPPYFDVASGTYNFSTGPWSARRCARNFDGFRFFYKNILAPKNGPPHDATHYMACAGDDVIASYASLHARDWTLTTLPLFQEMITTLFNEILLDIDVSTHPLPGLQGTIPCNMALLKLAHIRGDLEAQGAGYGEWFTKALTGSDCGPEQLKSFLLDHGFWLVFHSQGKKPDTGISMAVAYRKRGFRPLAWLLNSRYEARLVFSPEGRFIESQWGVPK